MCRLLGVSKQAYYKHDDKLLRRLALESFVVDYVKEVRRKDPGMGGGKLWKMYNRRFGPAWHVGLNRFYAIMERHGLKLRRRKRRAATTDSCHGLPVYPNLVKELIPDAPCQLIVSDITYIVCCTDPLTGEYTFCYLSLITDYYTKEIVGYSVGETLESRYPLEALEMALRHYGDKDLSGLIHHSDRGVQYARRVHAAAEETPNPYQHDRERQSERQRSGRTGKRHDKERASWWHDIPGCQSGKGGGEDGGGLL